VKLLSPVAVADHTLCARVSAVSVCHCGASQAEDKCALVRRVALQLQERSRALAAENASLRSQVRHLLWPRSILLRLRVCFALTLLHVKRRTLHGRFA